MKTRRLALPFAALALVLAACGGGGDGGGGGGGGGGESTGTVSYWLWDSNQQPAYQACADAFQEANPDITIEITQRGWDDYWATLTTGFASQTAPDVFTNHLSKYPEFVAQEQLVALDDYIEQDSVPTDIYAEGLAELWVGQDDARYGLPKDWDTVALFYNKTMTDEAGITEEQMNSLTWNPDDGGTYEEVIAKLSVDENGVRGNEPGFDKDNVAVYGLGLAGSGGPNGQTEWSMYPTTLGWTHTDQNPWGTHYNFDDPLFQESIAWWHGLIEKGYMPPLETTVGASVNDTFAAGKAAINTNGSWMIGTYTGYDGIELGIAPTPEGPEGRKSMFNGLADSIWVGSPRQDAAWEWVKFLGSKECQDIVAEAAVVFPAIEESIPAAQAAFEAKGVDVTPFTIHIDEGSTFLFPITDNAADIVSIMTPAMDAVMSGQADVSSLSDANEEVNALFE